MPLSRVQMMPLYQWSMVGSWWLIKSSPSAIRDEKGWRNVASVGGEDSLWLYNIQLHKSQLIFGCPSSRQRAGFRGSKARTYFPMRNIRKSRMGGYPPDSSIFFTSYPALAIISIMVCRLILSILAEDQSILDCLDFVTPSS